MLITIEQAVSTYDISRRTIKRRQTDGTLTVHHHPDTGVMLVDTRQLDTLFTHDADGGIPGTDETRAIVHGPASPRLDWSRLPHPDELDEAVRRALEAPRLPRLFPRRR